MLASLWPILYNKTTRRVSRADEGATFMACRDILKIFSSSYSHTSFWNGLVKVVDKASISAELRNAAY